MTVCCQDMLDGSGVGLRRLFERGSLATDVQAGDGVGVAAWPDGDLFAVVQDPVVGVLDDDGDDLPDMALTELDPLLVDQEAAAGVDPSLGAEGAGRQRGRG